MSNTNITVRPIGGLGNQMFCYAAAYALARRRDCNLEIDIGIYDNYKLWPYGLAAWRIPQQLAAPKWQHRPVTASLWRKISRGCLRGLVYRCRRLFSLYAERNFLYVERNFHFEEDLISKRPPLILEGYFQSWRYFHDFEVEIREIFQPANPLSSQANDFARLIKSHPNSVCIHVRRRDYLSAVNQQEHGVLGKAYFLKAAQIMRGLLPQAQFFFFSDDPDWVEEELLGDLPGELYRSENNYPWEEIFLMSQCQHNIIANSSFSWWEAYLNVNPKKVVIAPRQWFPPHFMRQRNCCDLLPPDWITI